MNAEERAAHDRIVAWCRTRPANYYRPGLREQHQAFKHPAEEHCLVVDLERTEPIPGAPSKYDRRSLRIASGATWLEVATKLGL